MNTNKNWIKGAINPAHKGALHKALGVPEGQKIPISKLRNAAESGGVTARRARLAITLRKMH